MKILNLILIVFGCIFLVSGCTGSKLDEHTVAVVKNEKISTDDLILNYELMPGWASSKKGKEALAAHVDLLLQKKLFALEGRRQGFDRDPEVQRIVNWIKADELRKALYRDEIEAKIPISESDLKTAFQKENVQFQVRHLFARTEAEINALQKALDQGISWDELAQATFTDSNLAKSGGALGWIGVGQMDPVIEDTIFALPAGRISQPVRSRYGFHLIQVLNTRQNIFMAEENFQSQKERLFNQLRRREEKKRADAFIKTFMAEKDVKMINQSFDHLVAKIRDNVIDTRDLGQLNLPQIKDGELDNLSQGLENRLNDVLITFKGGEWTIGDFLEKLYQIPPARRPRVTSPIKFRDDLGIMIRNEFLTQEARRRGLDNDPLVQKEVKHWQDEYTFSRLWQDIEATISISDSQAQTFFERHRARYWLPDQIRVSEILVKTRSQAQKIIRALNQGVDFSELAQKYSLRKSAAERGGDLGWITPDQLGNISEVALKMPPGEISAPIQVEGGFAVIQVTDRQQQRDKTFAEARDQVIADARREQRGVVYNQWVAKLKQSTHFEINDSLLTRLAQEIKTENRVLMPGVRPVY